MAGEVHLMRRPRTAELSREHVDAAGAKISAVAGLWGEPGRSFAVWQFASLERRYWQGVVARHAHLPYGDPIDRAFVGELRKWRVRERMTADIAAEALAQSPAAST